MFEVSGNTCNNAFQLGMQECCVANCSNLLLVLLHLKVQQIDATLSHCKLKSRCCTYKITTHPKHCHATQFRCCKLKQHVAASLNWCHLATTTFCCVTMQFEVGGNTCNNAFQLATQQCCLKVEERCCPYYRAFKESLFRENTCTVCND